MASLTAIFGNVPGDSKDSEKLLELYWNRAELKKEFARLREEKFRLGERIKERDSEIARTGQKLEHLENLLLDPEWAYNVVVYYQFRALDRHCASKLARFAEQLKQQREQRQHRQLLDEWNGKRSKAAARLEAMVLEQQETIRALDQELQDQRSTLMEMGPIVRFFRKRSVIRRLDGLAEQLESAKLSDAKLRSELGEVRTREAPDTQGLDTAAKRSINFMILAFAQQLYLHYEDDNIAALAKEAGEKSVGAINYGSKRDCDDLLDKALRRRHEMPAVTDFADVLKERATFLATNARFRTAEEAVPTAASVTGIALPSRSGFKRECNANLLGENYWGLAKILSR